MQVQSAQQKIQNKSKNQQFQLITGAISGALSRTVVAPIERVIILQQTRNINYQNQSIFQMLVNMLKNEGFSSMFKGNYPNCLRIAPFQAIEFYSNDQYKRIIGNYDLNTTQKYLLSGALAGATATLFVYPLDLIKTILAVNTNQGYKSESILSIYRGIIQKDGFFALYNGMKPTLCGMAPYASLKLTFFQTIKDIFIKNENFGINQTFVNLFCGSVAGCMAVTITYPTDLIRRRMQVSVLSKENKLGIIKTFQQVKKQDGIKGLYTGLLPTYLKIIPSTALVFSLNEFLKQKLNIY